MNIPNFEDNRFVDKDGHLTDSWRLIMQQLFQQLQQHVSQEGFILPQQNSDTIGKLTTTKSIGAMIYNSDMNMYQVCESTGPTTSEFKTVVTSKKL